MIDVIVFCLALNIYFEARSEPIEGQYAVAEVTIMRAEISGRSMCEEVFTDRQFSWHNGANKNRPKVVNKNAWTVAQAVATSTLTGPTRFSNGATHYHANYIRKPKWAEKLCECARIGRHIFYKTCKE